MIILEVMVLGIVIGLLLGGSLGRLERASLIGGWVLLVAFIGQLIWPVAVVSSNVPAGPAVGVWVLTMSAMALILLANSRTSAALSLAGLGVALNVLAIGANGAMPVDLRAAVATGVSADDATRALEGDLLHSEMDDGTMLKLLGDVIPVPGPKWQRGVVSIGDLFLAFGLSVWLCSAVRGPVRTDQGR